MTIVPAELDQRFAECAKQAIEFGRFVGQLAIQSLAYFTRTSFGINSAGTNRAEILHHQLDGGVRHTAEIIGRWVEQ